jgi:hypothetical protein
MAKGPDRPPLTVVDPASSGVSPPRKLGQHGLPIGGGYPLTVRNEAISKRFAAPLLVRRAPLCEALAADAPADFPEASKRTFDRFVLT